MKLTIFTRLLVAAALLVAPTVAAAQANPSVYTTGTRYDATGRVTGTISPDPDGINIGTLRFPAVRNTYDTAGRLTKVESGELLDWQSEAVAPSAWPQFTILKTVDTTYDALDRKIKETVSGGGQVKTVTQYSYIYNTEGRLECAAIRMNEASFNSLPSSACDPGTQGTLGPDRITKNFYDPAGQLLQVRKGVGTSIEAAEATYSYTPNGKREYVIDANGNRAQLVYDGFDRQVQWIFPSTNGPSSYNDSTQLTALNTAGSVNTNDFEQYGYDANGNRTSLRKRDGSTLTYAYDTLNRLTTKVVPERPCPGPQCLTAAQTRDVHYDYDLRGLMTTARFDSLLGEGIASAYNGFGDLVSTTTVLNALGAIVGHSYDKEGRRVSLTHPDGQQFTYARDFLGRVSNIYEGASQVSDAQLIQNQFDNRGLIDWMQRATSGAAFKADFTFDPIGRLASTFNDAAAGTANDLTISQGYNPASQIISQTRDNAAYSWMGAQALTRNYTTNGLNQYTVAGPASFTYDANGNLTSDGSTGFVYDVENRLVSASGAQTATLFYDPMGRLFQVMGTGTNIRFVYDGDELIAEYDSLGTLANRYVHSDNVDDPVVFYDGAGVGAGARTFLMPDERGSIAGLFYNDGTSRAKNSYDEYGIPGASNQGRFQYTGQIWINELGMYYYKARIYSPTLGRFLQVDPIGYDDQINLYAYVGNDPVNMADPTGLDGSNDHYEDVRAGRQPAVVPVEKASSSARTLFKAVGAAASVHPAVRTFLRVVQAVERSLSAQPAPKTGTTTAVAADRTAGSPLRRDPNGRPQPDPEAAGTKHTQLGTRQGSDGKPYRQTREFDESGAPVRDRDFTDHGRNHPNPHQHKYEPNPTGGTPKRGPYEPFEP